MSPFSLYGEDDPMGRRTSRFGERIRALRLAKGMTLREFARLLEVSPTYVSQIEQDKYAPPAEERVLRMAEILDQDADELLALAGRVADDLPEIIRRHPRELATFLRTVRDLPAAEIRKLTEQAQKRKSQRRQE